MIGSVDRGCVGKGTNRCICFQAPASNVALIKPLDSTAPRLLVSVK